MNCNQARVALDAAFDDGVPLDVALNLHVAQCIECRAHQAGLEALDLRIKNSPALLHDGALIARIQATIAAQPPSREPRWFPVAVGLAALILLTGLGYFVDPVALQSISDLQTWLPQESVIPEWPNVKQAFISIPSALAGDVQTIVLAVGLLWGNTVHWSSNILGTNSPVLWTVFFTCLASAIALNSLEWRSRHR